MEEQTKATDFEVTGDEFVTGFALNGEYVKNLVRREFEVVAQKTILLPDIDNPALKKKKLVLTVKLFDGTTLDYYPNKTSQKTIITKKGFKLDNWIGFKGRFITESQKVGLNKRDVIYVDADEVTQ